MAKRYRKDYSKDEKELEELEGKFKEEVNDDLTLKSQEQKLEEKPEDQLNQEELTFKKRYGDLRKHLAEKEKQWQMKEQDYEKRLGNLENSMKEQIELPDVSSKEEAEAWIQKYPDLAKVFRYLALEQDQKVKEDISKTKEQLQELEFTRKRNQAYMVLLDYHPDFDKIKESQDFIDWLLSKSQKYQDALWKNIDPHEAAFVVDMYKNEKGLTKKEQTTKETKKKDLGAAETVSRPTSNSPSEKEEVEWSESYVEEMSKRDKRWFDKNEDKIMEMIRKGKFKFDITGGAR